MTQKRDKIEENNKSDQVEDEVSTTVKCEKKCEKEKCNRLKRRRCVEEERKQEQETAEETLCRQAEEASSAKQYCGEESCAQGHENTTAEANILSSCLTDSASAINEKKDAHWVDSNRAKLIQNVTLVMPIADEMLQLHILHKETYSQIKASTTSQDQMRELYQALTSTKAKSAFFRILREIQPETCETEDDIKEVIKKNKESLRTEYGTELEGSQKVRKSLDKIYTELHIVRGESDHVNEQHEIWEIEDKTRNQTAEGMKINCNEIFHNMAEGEGEERIRTVMTKGIAGIGKTMSVKKFILDWADGKANQDLDFIFMLPFRKLNLVIDDPFSLEKLVTEFHPELKNTARIFAGHKVLFIFDGLDECQPHFKLNFNKTRIITDPSKETTVDILVTNLIRKNLLPPALIWITSRPGAVQRIPRQFVCQWTEVRGFSDPQKIQYFRTRVEDKAVAEQIIDHITTSRSLYIMCHIPIFCWMAAKVLVYFLEKMGNTRDEIIKIPTTLTEMYTNFLLVQMRVATEKYENQEQPEAEIFKANEEFIFKLGRLAFEELEKGKIIFSSDDLKKYDIDIKKAGDHCGLCTAIFKEESVFITKKLYCFVHLTVQEYFAALFVYRSFASKKIDSLSLKDFLLKGSEEEVKPILDADPVDLPLDELVEIAIANSTQRKTGELDMFLRFLIGMSLQSTQDPLKDLFQQTEEQAAVVENIRKSLTEIDLADCSPERCLNLIHCLIELEDSSLHDTVRQYLKPNCGPEKQLSPVHCSALADSILMSNTPLDEFNLMKFRPSAKGIFRLLPAVRNCRKAVISGVDLDSWLSETISSALRMPNSVLTELHLIINVFYGESSKILADGLRHARCELQALSLSGFGIWNTEGEELESAIKSVLSNLRELELSGNILGSSLLLSVVSGGLSSPKLLKLRLNRNPQIGGICKELLTVFTSNTCYLRELELSSTNFKDSEMEILSTGLMSANCTLETLSLSHNKLTEKGCELLASAVSSRPSPLRELDLSYNNLRDSGVMVLGDALKHPHCGLKTLRLSFCKVTEDGCSSLVTALKSVHCSLRVLDLSFNHLTDRGVKLLTEIQKDPHYSLENLNVDHDAEYWVDLRLLRQYACDLTLDPNTAGNHLILAEENKKATHVHETQPYAKHQDRFCLNFQVLCEQGLTGRHYWEVECVSAEVGVAYRSMDRVGDVSTEYSLGRNEKSWCWTDEGIFYQNNTRLQFVDRPTKTCVMGVYLDWPAGILSFFEVFPDALMHLYTERTTFTEPLHPCFSLHEGSVSLRKIT